MQGYEKLKIDVQDVIFSKHNKGDKKITVKRSAVFGKQLHINSIKKLVIVVENILVNYSLFKNLTVLHVKCNIYNFSSDILEDLICSKLENCNFPNLKGISYERKINSFIGNKVINFIYRGNDTLYGYDIPVAAEKINCENSHIELDGHSVKTLRCYSFNNTGFSLIKQLVVHKIDLDNLPVFLEILVVLEKHYIDITTMPANVNTLVASKSHVCGAHSGIVNITCSTCDLNSQIHVKRLNINNYDKLMYIPMNIDELIIKCTGTEETKIHKSNIVKLAVINPRNFHIPLNVKGVCIQGAGSFALSHKIQFLKYDNTDIINVHTDKVSTLECIYSGDLSRSKIKKLIVKVITNTNFPRTLTSLVYRSSVKIDLSNTYIEDLEVENIDAIIALPKTIKHIKLTI